MGKSNCPLIEIHYKVQETLDVQARTFYCRIRDDPSWAQECLMKFISSNRGEISGATVPNYYKAVKLFCEMNDLTLS